MWGLLIFIPIFLFTITVHEYAHGLVARFFGDSTASDVGRLTLNPLKHIDPLWTVCLPIFLMAVGLPVIGMAKPVPVNFMNLRRPKQDMIWVAMAGPLANIFFASLLAPMYQWSRLEVVLVCVYFNLGLAVFNMLPIPPLDGSRILVGLLPNRWAYRYSRLEPFGFLVVLLLVWLGLLGRMVVPAINFFCRVLELPLIRF